MNFYLTLPIFQAVLSLILLVIVLRAKSQDTSRYIFAMYLGGLLVWGIFIYFMRSSPNLDAALFWEKILLPLGLLLSVILYHFSVTFCGFRARKRIIATAYATCALLLILSEMGFVVADMQMKSYGYAPVAGPLFLTVALISNALVFAAVINLWRFSRTALFKEERNRSKYIILGMIISIIGGAMDVLPLLGLSLYPGLIIGNILFCLITSIAILRHRLLGIHLIMRKGITYFLTSAIAATPYLILLLIFERILRTNLPLWATILTFICLAFVLQPIWRVAQSLVDKLFFMSRYDFLKSLDDFSQKAHRITNINALGDSLVNLVKQALQASGVYLLLPSAQGEYNLISSAGEKGDPLEVNPFSHNPVLSWLRSHKVVLRREEIIYISRLQSLTTAEINEINALNAELFVPVLDKEDDLVGILILGPKLSRKPYSDEDEQLILTVSQRLALELENAHLYSLEIMARKELQQQADMRTEFLHSAAHELKTPLTAIIASSEMLIEKLASTNEDLEQRLTNNIYESSLAMNRRVSELLDFARVQIGSLEINRQVLDINQVARDVICRLTPLFTSRQQHLGLEFQNTASVKADKDKLEQVIINLLSNANKYSPSESDIFIRTKQINNDVLVEIEDSAVIISESERNRLFQPYYRGEDVKARQRIPGLGLGLAISKKIIEMHGGKIWVDSHPGKGNIFIFSLTAAA